LPARFGVGPTQEAAPQNPPETQSVSFPQVVKQPATPASPLDSQRKLLQLTGAFGWQTPCPVQIDPTLTLSVPEHVDALEHGVPAGQRTHAPEPLHAVPSMPHMSAVVAIGAQSPRGSPNAPLTGRQVVPFVLSQVWQVAEQFVPAAQQKWL